MIHWLDIIYHFSISKEKLNMINRKMKKRHPNENWLVPRKDPHGDIVYYLRLEYYCWLEEVYFNHSGFYLDREIAFFKKQIARLEIELNVNPIEKEYSRCTIKELCFLFGKNKSAILKAIQRMQERNNDNYKTFSNHQLVISQTGVKWLDENYFRKDYLYKLEEYKLKLQIIKRRIYDETRSI